MGTRHGETMVWSRTLRRFALCAPTRPVQVVSVRISVALIAAAAASCGGSKDALPRLSTAVDTVAGVVHVRNAGEADQPTLTRLFSVGAPGDAVEFGRIMSVVADAEGRVYVADGIESRVSP